MLPTNDSLLRWPLPPVVGSPDLRVLSASPTSVGSSEPSRVASSVGPYQRPAGTQRISLVRIQSFDPMPAVRTPEALHDTRHDVSWNIAFSIERLDRLLRPRSISGLTLRSLSFRPTVSLSTLRSTRLPMSHARLGTRWLARPYRGRHFRRRDCMRLQGATLAEPDWVRYTIRLPA